MVEKAEDESPNGTGSILVGLVGAGIQASRTPHLHESEGRAQGILYLYKLIDLEVLGLATETLHEILTAAERLGFSGLNITYPCKQAVIELLDDLSADARTIGAVNTVVFNRGRRIGHNTDSTGFAQSFRRTLGDVPRKRVVQLGAGGAGAAVSHALLTLGTTELVIIDTEHRRAEALAESICSRFGTGRAIAERDTPRALRDAQGLVNATPVGMAKLPGMPLPAPLLTPRLWVADVIYFPLETKLLHEARTRGCRAMSGAGMAVFQAAEAFRLFTTYKPDVERMLRNFEHGEV